MYDINFNASYPYQNKYDIYLSICINKYIDKFYDLVCILVSFECHLAYGNMLFKLLVEKVDKGMTFKVDKTLEIYLY